MATIVDKNAKALIFDLDGTLLDSMPIHFEAWQKVSKKMNFPHTEELFLELAGMPTAKIVEILNERYNLSLDSKKVLAEKKFLYHARLGDIKPFPIMEELVLEYHGKLPMAIGTGATMVDALKVLESTDFLKYFDVIVSSDDVAHHKPHPETFLLCAEKMNIESEFCQVFEDGELGIKAGKDAGMIVTDVRPIFQK